MLAPPATDDPKFSSSLGWTSTSCRRRRAGTFSLGIRVSQRSRSWNGKILINFSYPGINPIPPMMVIERQYRANCKRGAVQKEI